MTITLNGEPKQVSDGLTVSGLLRDMDLEQGAVAVAINSEFIPRGQHMTHKIQAGDKIELVAPMQGG